MAPDAAGNANGGLSVAWATQPSTLPGDVGNNINVQRVLFRIGYLQIIGDAAPSDLRTTAFDLTAEWSRDKQPDTVKFNDAPTGVYSKLAVDIDGHIMDSSVEIDGRVTISGNTKDFEVRDPFPYMLALDTDKTLQPGGHVGFGLKVDFGHALGAIDWSQVPTHDGHYELSPDPMNPQSVAQLGVLHDSLTEAIQVDDSITHSSDN